MDALQHPLDLILLQRAHQQTDLFVYGNSILLHEVFHVRSLITRRKRLYRLQRTLHHKINVKRIRDNLKSYQYTP